MSEYAKAHPVDGERLPEGRACTYSWAGLRKDLEAMNASLLESLGWAPGIDPFDPLGRVDSVPSQARDDSSYSDGATKFGGNALQLALVSQSQNPIGEC